MTDVRTRRPITNHRAMGASVHPSAAVEQPFPAPTRTQRLLMREGDSVAGQVDGAWWPWTDNLTAELHDLVSALTGRLGTTVRIGFDWNAVSISQRRIDRADGIDIIGPGVDQAGDTIRLFGADGTHATLLVVAAHTSPDEAYDKMRNVSVSAELSTVRGISPNIRSNSPPRAE
ncbi:MULTISPECIES: DUF5994 family protein [Nocardia]|uniref:DUF5994 family protein n=1 Tax=Nocardia TaxID=1817 RepID=UPI001E62AB8A|nr:MULTISPECIES: DUF5994 family protein [Nocardia]